MLTRQVPLIADDSDAARIANAISVVIGNAFPAPSGSINAADRLALGAALAEVESNLLEAAEQAFPLSATWLLKTWELKYELPQREGLDLSERARRLAARVMAKVSGSPRDIARALAVLASSDVTYDETTVLEAQSSGEPRNVFRVAFFFQDNTKWSRFHVDAQAIIEAAKPAYVNGYIAVSDDFLTDDAESLTDRDALSL